MDKAEIRAKKKLTKATNALRWNIKALRNKKVEKDSMMEEHFNWKKLLPELVAAKTKNYDDISHSKVVREKNTTPVSKHKAWTKCSDSTK